MPKGRPGKPSGHYTQAARLHNVIRLIESKNGITLDELVEETGVDLRTVHRDLAAVQEAGYPLTTEWVAGKKVYSFLTKSRQIHPIVFTLEELVSLHLLRSLSTMLPAAPFGREIDALFAKIHSSIPPRSAAHLERIGSVALPRFQGLRDYSGSAEILSELRRGLLYQYRTKLFYTRSGKLPAEYLVNPYSLVFAKGGLYLLAFAHNRNAIRLFAVERISSLEVSRQRFEIPEDFNPEACFADAFGLVSDAPMRIRVRFDSEVAQTVRERVWRENQKVTDEPDGSVVIEFEASGSMEIVAWVLSYGRHAELLAPPELRKEIRRQIKNMRERYKKSQD